MKRFSHLGILGGVRMKSVRGCVAALFAWKRKCERELVCVSVLIYSLPVGAQLAFIRIRQAVTQV